MRKCDNPLPANGGQSCKDDPKYGGEFQTAICVGLTAPGCGQGRLFKNDLSIKYSVFCILEKAQYL